MTPPPPASDSAAGAGTRRAAPGRAARLRFLATPRWLVLQVVVILFVLACYFLLAPWQFSRSQQHDAELAAVAAATAQSPAEVDAVMSADEQPDEAEQWRQVTATGHFRSADEAYIRLRQDPHGQPAYEVVVPFVTDTGTVLVDRGYFPFRAVAEGLATPPDLPAGEVTITGRLQPDQVDPKDRPPAPTPDGRTAYIAVSSQILSGSDGVVYRGYLTLVPDSPGVIEAIPVPRGDDARPFYSYAIQWLSFGAIAVVGLGYFIYREYRDPADGSIYLPERSAAAPEAAIFEGVGAAAGDSGRSDPGPPERAQPAASGRRAKFDKSTLYDD